MWTTTKNEMYIKKGIVIIDEVCCSRNEITEFEEKRLAQKSVKLISCDSYRDHKVQTKQPQE